MHTYPKWVIIPIIFPSTVVYIIVQSIKVQSGSSYPLFSIVQLSTLSSKAQKYKVDFISCDSNEINTFVLFNMFWQRLSALDSKLDA